MTSAGIRYSNIEPDQESSAEPRPTGRQRAAEAEPVRGGDVALGDRDEARQPRLGGEQVVVARVEACRPRRGSRSRRACAVGSKRKPKSIAPDRAACAPRRRCAWSRRTSADRAGASRPASPAARIGQLGDAWRSASPPADAAEQSRGPARWLSTARRAALGPRRRASPVTGRLAVAPRSGRARCPRASGACAASSASRAAQAVGRRRDARRARPASALSGLVELPRVTVWLRRSSPSAPPPRATSASASSMPAQRFGDRAAAGRRISRQALAEHEQVAGEVAAVDRGHVARARAARGRACRTSCRSGPGSARGGSMRRAASPRAARPVSGVPIQPKSRAATVDEQVEPDVRRRRAVRDDRLGVLLEVVGRQASGPPARRRSRRTATSGARSARSVRDVRRRELRRRRRARRQADPAGDQRREHPQHEERRGDHGSVPAAPATTSAPRRRRGASAPRHAPVERPRARGRAPALACAAVIHSSSRRRVTVQRGRACARSRRSSATPGARRNVTPRAICATARATSSPDGAQVAPLRDAPPRGDQAAERPGRSAGSDDGREHERRPHARRMRRERSSRRRGSARRPAPTACAGGCRASSSAPMSGIRSGRSRRRRPREDPGQQLPVAARPPVLAGGGDLVVRRELLEELDVGDEPGAREDALEEVVAQERVLGHAAVQRRARTRRRRRCPCRCRSPRRRGPGRRRRPRPRRDRCRPGRRRSAGRATRRARPAAWA